MMTPNIYDIIRTCLSIAKRIICYFPRTSLLTEFFEILDEILGPDSKSHIYVDIHILNSANKIKAVMLVFGNELSEVLLKLQSYNIIGKQRGFI
jgi:hypothetical protein